MNNINKALELIVKERDKFEYMLKGNPKMSDRMKEWMKDYIDSYNICIHLLKREIENEKVYDYRIADNICL